MGSELRKSVEMRTSLILLSCLVGLTLQRGKTCDDGSRPTCEDGSQPDRGSRPPCPEGRPNTCADGSEPTRQNGDNPSRPTGVKGTKCEDGSRPTCEDGSKPQKGNLEPPCEEGLPMTCADGSTPSQGNGRGKGKCPKKDRVCCDGTDTSGQGKRKTCDDGAKPRCPD